MGVRLSGTPMPRLGKQKTIVAVEHSILIAVWHLLRDNVSYHDLGGDYDTKQDPQRAIRRIIGRANDLGLAVRFDPIPGAAYQAVSLFSVSRPTRRAHV